MHPRVHPTPSFSLEDLRLDNATLKLLWPWRDRKRGSLMTETNGLVGVGKV